VGCGLPLAFLPGVGFPELALVFVAVLVLFGPRKLPEIARRAGRMAEELRRAVQDFRAQLMNLDGQGEAGDDRREPVAGPAEEAPPSGGGAEPSADVTKGEPHGPAA